MARKMFEQKEGTLGVGGKEQQRVTVTSRTSPTI
jgi:hypothetical protein